MGTALWWIWVAIVLTVFAVVMLPVIAFLALMVPLILIGALIA